tara:strand:- start:688 stop:1464 length:777 start_codon:yes stop_codon:yes gene_type:complete
MKFIQLCGAGRAGKSTIASILYDVAYENNYIPVILPFAKALKKEAADLGFTKEKDPDGYRKYCQKWGEGRRKEDADYWVNKVRAEVEELKTIELRNKQDQVERFEHIVIQDDVRYMNEIAFGREVEAYQIFITTGDRDLDEPFDSWRFHESETLATMVEMGHKDYVDIFHEYLVNREPVPELQDYIRDRFFTWIMSGDPATDPTTELYRNGLQPNDHFLKLYMLKDELDKLDNIVDLLENEIERLSDPTDEEFKEGAD